jgi:hypothetical protein
MVSKILIEYEQLDRPKALRLIVDDHLVAENLTPEETRNIIVKIFERIAVLDVEEDGVPDWAKGRERTH